MERLELVERLIRREQIVRDRLNPMTFYNDADFINRFRQSKDADLFGVNKCTVSRIIRKVSRAKASLYHTHIILPSRSRLLDVQLRAFMRQSNIPGVVGLNKCTHIPIISPGGENAELFRNRKGYFSINVQAICDHELKLTNVVRWPGSTHDSRIFDNSNICAKFERMEINGILLGYNGYPLRPFNTRPHRKL